MKVFTGTSGFSYSWNPNGFEWYLENSGLNSVELNSSFYRYPYPNQVKSWLRKTEKINPNLRWSIKVTRLVTHLYKFNQTAWKRWKSFERLFSPLDKFIDFYLFQLPPSTKPNSAKKIENFFKKTNLKKRFALEWRNVEWFEEEWVKWAKSLGLTLVSVDAPDFTKLPRRIFNVNGIVYLRMHGRSGWYSHNYKDIELKGIKKKILKVKPKKVYVYFNNDHNMLSNARRMLEILR
jgi:uncharacterized protein YecE (DUF72 family)